ncbi:MAG: Rv3235 family protein [Actinomycetaceae bacterium]|nr:Rv3235 family protein [Arcanobacterium sp.]MDD7505008.1 Rv3235 family protein [Actinomycetaceae bacterium]MDY6143335.1 Rv3235 family protein [Arcanobacterium sp.]
MDSNEPHVSSPATPYSSTVLISKRTHLNDASGCEHHKDARTVVTAVTSTHAGWGDADGAHMAMILPAGNFIGHNMATTRNPALRETAITRPFPLHVRMRSERRVNYSIQPPHTGDAATTIDADREPEAEPESKVGLGYKPEPKHKHKSELTPIREHKPEASTASDSSNTVVAPHAARNTRHNRIQGDTGSANGVLRESGSEAKPQGMADSQDTQNAYSANDGRAAPEGRTHVIHFDDDGALDEPLPHDFPDARRIGGLIARQCIETLIGLRPMRYLQAWMTPGVFHSFSKYVSALHAGRMRNPRNQRHLAPRIVNVRAFHPKNRVAEVSAIVFDGRRVRAVAVRLEVRRRKWIVTALEIA